MKAFLLSRFGWLPLFVGLVVPETKAQPAEGLASIGWGAPEATLPETVNRSSGPPNFHRREWAYLADIAGSRARPTRYTWSVGIWRMQFVCTNSSYYMPLDGLRWGYGIRATHFGTTQTLAYAGRGSAIGHTLFVEQPSVTAVNAAIRVEYRPPTCQAMFLNLIGIGFSLDLAGVGFGPSRAAADDAGRSVNDVRPAWNNLLLINRNDRGALNSEFYLNFPFPLVLPGELRIGLQHLAVGYKHGTDRYQRLSNQLVVGFRCQLDLNNHSSWYED